MLLTDVSGTWAKRGAMQDARERQSAWRLSAARRPRRYGASPTSFGHAQVSWRGARFQLPPSDQAPGWPARGRQRVVMRRV